MTVKQEMLTLLENLRGKAISGEETARRLGVSRAAVWKAVSSLREEGHRIGAETGKGYWLEQDSDIITTQSLLALLPDFDPARLTVLQETDSTNTVAKKLAQQGAPAGSFVIASRQTGGKGRRGRSFFSPEGGIYLSVLLRPQMSAEESIRITTAAAVMTCRAIEEICGISPAIKWVNDLYYQGKKVCGILTEASMDLETKLPEYVIAGIGVNLKAPKEGYPPELSSIAGALFEQCPPEITRSRLAAAMIRRLSRLEEECRGEEMLADYRRRCPLAGKTVEVLRQPPRRAKVLSITPQCGLLVQYDSGETEELSSGEVSIDPACMR
ncbi:biotin--[acetyl-CoA-carboxylase] ligase [Acidaminobacterium chupaoyuni]